MSISILSEFKDLIPPLSSNEFAELEKSIKQDGCRDAIVTYGGNIIDGHNRYEICTSHDIAFNIVEYSFDSNNDAKEWMIMNQFGRRNLPIFVRAELALKLKPIIAEKAKERQAGGGKDKVVQNSAQAKTRDIIAEKAGVSHDTIAKTEKVLNKAKPETVDKLRRGEISLNEAHTEIKKEQLLINREEKIDSIKEFNTDLDSDDKFNIIYADPPWRYDFSKSNSREIENQYPTMDLEELKALEVPVAEDSILFMWTTSPKLADSIELINAWGFEYKTCAVWDKQKIGMGYYFRQQHELLLIATKGSLPVPEPSNRKSSVFSYPRGKHSAKPHEFYELITEMYPEYADSKYRIELFCRTPQADWAVWGNQSAL